MWGSIISRQSYLIVFFGFHYIGQENMSWCLLLVFIPPIILAVLLSEIPRGVSFPRALLLGLGLRFDCDANVEDVL